jgi:cephalosporin-C deacetylase-like acetyl esterase
MTKRLVLALAVAALASGQQLSFTPLHESGIYDLNEKVSWSVALASGAAAPAGGFRYAVRKNNADTIQSGVLDLSTGSAVIEAKSDQPAMLYVEVETTPPTHLGAAVAPTQLKPSVPRPDDFDAFWAGKLKALADIPIHPALTRVETTRPGVELYTVKLDSVGSHVQGYLAKPAREGRFPALMIYQYAGVYALRPETVTDRAAEGWLAFDVDSHDLPPGEAAGVSRNYQAIGNTDREASYFLNMYLRDIRAIDYMASRPDWDGKTMAAVGTSMGGQQSLVAAGLDPRITSVLVNEPSGADSNGDLHGRKAGYPNWPSNDPKVMQTAVYFDTVNFASRIKAPVLMAIGFIDTTSPPAGLWTVVNQIPGPKEVIFMVESDHNNRTPEKQGAWNSRSEDVLNTIRNGGNPWSRP